jgi:hypothetical protein
MIVIGWTFCIFAVPSILGLGSMYIYLGPLDFKLPFRFR